MAMKAWRVYCPSICPEPGIYGAESRSKAKYRAYLGARDADYRIRITEFKATRAPEYDEWARVWEKGGKSEEFVKGLLNRK